VRLIAALGGIAVLDIGSNYLEVIERRNGS